MGEPVEEMEENDEWTLAHIKALHNDLGPIDLLFPVSIPIQTHAYDTVSELWSSLSLPIKHEKSSDVIASFQQYLTSLSPELQHYQTLTQKNSPFEDLLKLNLPREPLDIPIISSNHSMIYQDFWSSSSIISCLRGQNPLNDAPAQDKPDQPFDDIFLQQDKLHDYLDLVEISLTTQLATRFPQLLSVLGIVTQLQIEMTCSIKQLYKIKHILTTLKKSCCIPFLKIILLQRRRQRLINVVESIELCLGFWESNQLLNNLIIQQDYSTISAIIQLNTHIVNSKEFSLFHILQVLKESNEHMCYRLDQSFESDLCELLLLLISNVPNEIDQDTYPSVINHSDEQDYLDIVPSGCPMIPFIPSCIMCLVSSSEDILNSSDQIIHNKQRQQCLGQFGCGWKLSQSSLIRFPLLHYQEQPRCSFCSQNDSINTQEPMMLLNTTTPEFNINLMEEIQQFNFDQHSVLQLNPYYLKQLYVMFPYVLYKSHLLSQTISSCHETVLKVFKPWLRQAALTEAINGMTLLKELQNIQLKSPPTQDKVHFVENNIDITTVLKSILPWVISSQLNQGNKEELYKTIVYQPVFQRLQDASSPVILSHLLNYLSSDIFILIYCRLWGYGLLIIRRIITILMSLVYYNILIELSEFQQSINVIITHSTRDVTTPFNKQSSVCPFPIQTTLEDPSVINQHLNSDDLMNTCHHSTVIDMIQFDLFKKELYMLYDDATNRKKSLTSSSEHLGYVTSQRIINDITHSVRCIHSFIDVWVPKWITFLKSREIQPNITDFHSHPIFSMESLDYNQFLFQQQTVSTCMYPLTVTANLSMYFHRNVIETGLLFWITMQVMVQIYYLQTDIQTSIKDLLHSSTSFIEHCVNQSNSIISLHIEEFIKTMFDQLALSYKIQHHTFYTQTIRSEFQTIHTQLFLPQPVSFSSLPNVCVKFTSSACHIIVPILIQLLTTRFQQLHTQRIYEVYQDIQHETWDTHALHWRWRFEIIHRLVDISFWDNDIYQGHESTPYYFYLPTHKTHSIDQNINTPKKKMCHPGHLLQLLYQRRELNDYLNHITDISSWYYVSFQHAWERFIDSQDTLRLSYISQSIWFDIELHELERFFQRFITWIGYSSLPDGVSSNNVTAPLHILRSTTAVICIIIEYICIGTVLPPLVSITIQGVCYIVRCYIEQVMSFLKQKENTVQENEVKSCIITTRLICCCLSLSCLATAIICTIFIYKYNDIKKCRNRSSALQRNLLMYDHNNNKTTLPVYGIPTSISELFGLNKAVISFSETSCYGINHLLDLKHDILEEYQHILQSLSSILLHHYDRFSCRWFSQKHSIITFNQLCSIIEYIQQTHTHIYPPIQYWESTHLTPFFPLHAAMRAFEKDLSAFLTMLIHHMDAIELHKILQPAFETLYTTFKERVLAEIQVDGSSVLTDKLIHYDNRQPVPEHSNNELVFSHHKNVSRDIIEDNRLDLACHSHHCRVSLLETPNNIKHLLNTSDTTTVQQVEIFPKNDICHSTRLVSHRILNTHENAAQELLSSRHPTASNSQKESNQCIQMLHTILKELETLPKSHIESTLSKTSEDSRIDATHKIQTHTEKHVHYNILGKHDETLTSSLIEHNSIEVRYHPTNWKYQDNQEIIFLNPKFHDPLESWKSFCLNYQMTSYQHQIEHTNISPLNKIDYLLMDCLYLYEIISHTFNHKILIGSPSKKVTTPAIPNYTPEKKSIIQSIIYSHLLKMIFYLLNVADSVVIEQRHSSHIYLNICPKIPKEYCSFIHCQPSMDGLFYISINKKVHPIVLWFIINTLHYSCNNDTTYMLNKTLSL